MALNVSKIEEVMKSNNEESEFSGAVFVQENGETVFGRGYEFANRSEKISNTISTRFGMASGCKIFTAVAVCQLVEKGIISFDTPLKECLDISFPEFNPNITVHHLLTHSSGIADYFDEEVMDDFEELWKDRPTYNIRSPKDFLPMFQNGKMEFSPGEKFKYNNAGFIVLGLIVEQQSGMSFTEYVEKNIFAQCEMNDSGYFAMDQLPEGTAYGYIYNEENNTYRTNIFSVPIIGGPDGGAFTTAPDMAKFWTALLGYKLLNKEITEKLLMTHIQVDEDGEYGFYYGYGVWIVKKNNEILRYFVMGEDPGVDLISSIYPKDGVQITVISNNQYDIYPINKGIQNTFISE